MKYFTSEKTVIKSWCNDIEEGAINQAKNLANLPFVSQPVCLMSDTHLGYGAPIGTVLACDNVIIPNVIGKDIGCGILAVKSNLIELDVEKIKKIMGMIRGKIPLGFNRHKTPKDDKYMPDLDYDNLEIVRTQYESARTQVGTLGGGNHFIELQRDENGFIWFMIHSGSRNLGLQVAKHYNLKAKKLNAKYFSLVPAEWDLAFIPANDHTALRYLTEMNYCLEFAHCNRKLMASEIRNAFSSVIKDIEFEEEINIHHNYVSLEGHHGKNIWVHRKGATSAKRGEIGIIPGSQGTSSYIVEGLGNRESLMSCSHGAGRRMGRKQAQRELNLESEMKILNDKGIIHSIRNKNDLDEAPSAYKDISIVMEEQKDLVKVLERLEPLAVIKG